MAQNDKKLFLLHSISQEAYIIMIFDTRVKWRHIQFVFFSFFQNFDFVGCYGVKGQKMDQNDKKFCLSHSVSQEPYLVWLWFLVHMCKMMISPAICFSFLSHSTPNGIPITPKCISSNLSTLLIFPDHMEPC